MTAGIVCIIAAIVGGGLNAFKIEMPVVHSPVRQVLLAVFGLALLAIPNHQYLSGIAVFHRDCLSGEWLEDPSANLIWSFQQHGDKLEVRRLDNFVHGSFSRAEDTWNGTLFWGNGDKWDNVVFSPTQDCHDVKTNQAWSYRRK